MTQWSKLYIDMVALRAQIKLLHFQTKSYAVHKATDAFTETYDALFDTFWEVLQSNGKRIKLSSSGSSIQLTNESTPAKLVKMLDSVARRLSAVKEGFARVSADNLVEAFEQFKYLLTFD